MTAEQFMKSEKEAQSLGKLQKTNRRLLSQLIDAKASKQELVDAVFRGACDAMSTLDLPPLPKRVTLAQVREDRTPEVACAVLSDWQLGKRTKSYSSAMCEKRINLYMDKMLRLTEVERSDHPVNEAHMWLIGDMLEGELIFPGQAHQIDASLYRQVTVDGPRIVANVLRRALDNYDRVKVVGVIGNHGRIGGRSSRDMNPESNADRMIYRISKTVMDAMSVANVEQRIVWDIPDERNERSWYTVDTIGSKKCLLVHGDQFRGGGHGGLPWYSFAKKINAWAAGVIPGGFDYVFCGHWHQCAKLPLNNRFCFVNGTPESHNTYAQEEMAGAGRPSQLLVFMHPKHGITSERQIFLDHA